ncbi:MAG: DUF5667 domain-containing protein [Chloroflexi bacterium]|nr:DUF5667 domain-containing protein [Chloroflexota bacterium]
MKDNELDPRLAELLNELKSAPERNSRAALRGKNKFLAEAVSLSESRRHSGWKIIFHLKEKFAMNLIVSVLVIAGLLFGGGATVSAAQDALPTDALYPIKLLSEDAQLWLNGDPAAEIELLLQQAQTRTQEMAALEEKGVIPPQALTTRAQERIHQALEVAATLEETKVADTLLQIRDRLQTQDRLLSQLQDGTCAGCEPALDQTRDMLREQLRLVEDGLADPAGFIYRHRNQNGIPTPEPTEAPVTEEPTAVPTEEPAAAIEPTAAEVPAVTPQASCTPALDGTGLQNGNMGSSQQQNGNGEPPAEPGNNGAGNGQQNGGKP